MNIVVQQITAAEAMPWIKRRHYARRSCSISWAFGAYRDGELIGVVTYGMPPSRHLCLGVCGSRWADQVLELNRLCCENTRNVASLLVGRSLKMLPKPTIVVSYADTARGHVGYVYQATNFIYTGKTDAERKTPRGDRVAGQAHSRHDGRNSDGSVNTELQIVRRLPKHRYVFIVADRKQREEILEAMRYRSEPYPKGESARYDASGEIYTQMAFPQ